MFGVTTRIRCHTSVQAAIISAHMRYVEMTDYVAGGVDILTDCITMQRGNVQNGLRVEQPRKLRMRSKQDLRFEERM